jgi:selenocysteine-specific elongation factor
MARDRYIIRSYSPIITIGGGDILYTHPKKHKHAATVVPSLHTLQNGELADIVEFYVDQAADVPITARQIAGQVAFAETDIITALHQLLQRSVIVNTETQGLCVMHARHYQGLTSQILTILDRFHQNVPLKAGMAKEELRKKLPDSLPPLVFQHILNAQETAGHLEVARNLVRKTSHRIRLSAAQHQLKQQLEAMYHAGRYQPPGRKDALASLGTSAKESEEMLQLLLEDGTLIRIDRELYYHKDILADITAKVIEYLTKQHEMGVGDVKELFQVSRKYAVPLLAYLDASGVTIRKGDVRVLRTTQER